MTKELAVATKANCDRTILDNAPTYGDEDRTQGSGMRPLGIPDADKRDPDLVKDPLRLRAFAIRLSKNVDAQMWDSDADSEADPDSDTE